MKRNENLDFMRFLGVLLIMIAHSSPPNWMYQLTNFGTPLLIIISALTFTEIYKNRTFKPAKFLKKRIIKLIFPAWIFLTLFFIISYLIFNYNSISYPFSTSTILTSYTFYRGIGFVWIFKIYIILALITPYTFKLKNTLSFTKYFLVIIIGYILYEILMLKLVTLNIEAQLYDVIVSIGVVFIPYTLLYLYGLRLNELSNKTIIYISAASSLIFVIIAIFLKYNTGSFVQTYQYKFPPRLYYLSYAIAAIHVVYLIAPYVLANFKFKIFEWLSTNSLYIYLWHIPAYYIWEYTFKQPGSTLMLSLINVSFLLGIGIIMTYLQNYIFAKFNTTKHYVLIPILNRIKFNK